MTPAAAATPSHTQKFLAAVLIVLVADAHANDTNDDEEEMPELTPISQLRALEAYPGGIKECVRTPMDEREPLSRRLPHRLAMPRRANRGGGGNQTRRGLEHPVDEEAGARPDHPSTKELSASQISLRTIPPPIVLLHMFRLVQGTRHKHRIG